MARSKKYKEIAETKKDLKDPQSLEEAIEQVKKLSTSKFDGSIELHVATKSKEKDYSVRGSVSFPNAFGESKRVVVFCEEKDAEKASKAGAESAGLDKLIKKVQDGWMDFDIVLSTPQVMGEVAKLGPVLGPKGLMPNPKAGTVIKNFDAIEGFKSGVMTFKNDDSGVIHGAIGKISMDTKELVENAKSFVESVREACSKTKASVKNIHLAPTMGPSISLSPTLA